MSAKDYDGCEAHVLASEGGYTNNPKDPGGPTNWGITIYDARLYWKHDATPSDVKGMPLTVAQGIYRKKYWDALDCDDLPPGLDYSVFDYGVNSGIGRSGVVLRRCMGIPANDWHVTQDVIVAVAKRDLSALIQEIDDERLHFLEGLHTWSEFGRGWSARIGSVRMISLQMASGFSLAPKPLAAPVIVQAAGKGVADPSQMFSHLAAASWDAIKEAA